MDENDTAVDEEEDSTGCCSCGGGFCCCNCPRNLCIPFPSILFRDKSSIVRFFLVVVVSVWVFVLIIDDDDDDDNDEDNGGVGDTGVVGGVTVKARITCPKAIISSVQPLLVVFASF